METTVPCSAHPLMRVRYRLSRPRLPWRHPVKERHQPSALETYARHVAERRRRRYDSKSFSHLLNTARELTAPTADLEDDAPLVERFREQADKWSRETQHISSPTQMMMHPSYQAIMGMANENKAEVVKLMLQDMRENRREWFWALSYLTQDNPISSRDAGKMDKMIEAWLDWAKRKGIP